VSGPVLKERSMKTLLICLSILMASNLYAVDMATVDAPTVAERMSNAREAIKAKDWKRALAELKVAVRDEPRNADAHNLLAYSYRKQAKPDLPNAFEHYNIALKLNPNHRGAHEYLGEAYLMDRKPAEAEKHLADLEKICGNRTCEEYTDLSRAIADYKTRGSSSY
jgi:Tfp pilus assembly protein PilF